MIGHSPTIPEIETPTQPQDQAVEDQALEDKVVPRKENGGRDGPDPTRYGDWEKNGRCIDF